MIDAKTLEKRYDALKADAEAGSYYLNPDKEFVMDLVEGMLINQERYGMEVCPCRLFTGTAEDNLDIVCPCIYRDDDLAEYEACFCALYVSKEAAENGVTQIQVPDRWPGTEERKKQKERAARGKAEGLPTALPYPVWRCVVCGYLCANNHPPGICPVCKAKKDRFERFI
ncbi:MAG: ferredoxin-thioredoxin reductase catalytic domain-containing protein [Christensenellales bacterium]